MAHACVNPAHATQNRPHRRLGPNIRPENPCSNNGGAFPIISGTRAIQRVHILRQPNVYLLDAELECDPADIDGVPRVKF